MMATTRIATTMICRATYHCSGDPCGRHPPHTFPMTLQQPCRYPPHTFPMTLQQPCRYPPQTCNICLTLLQYPCRISDILAGALLWHHHLCKNESLLGLDSA